MTDRNGKPLKVGDRVKHQGYPAELVGQVVFIGANEVLVDFPDMSGEETCDPKYITLVESKPEKLDGLSGDLENQAYRKGFNEGHHKALQSPRNSTNWWEEDQWQYDLNSAPKGILLLVCTSSKTEDGEELNFVVAMRVDGGWIAAHGRHGKIYDSIKCWMRFSIPKIVDLSVRIFQKPE